MRIFMGIVWFVIFCILAVFIAGYVIGSKAPEEGMQKGFDEGYNHPTAIEFSKKYSGTIVIGSLILSVLGTATGILPGTRKRKKPR